MAGESPEYPAGNEGLVGRRARRHRPGRDSVALQRPRLRPIAHARPPGLRGRHARVPAPLHAASQDPAVRRYTPENRLLLPCQLRKVSDE